MDPFDWTKDKTIYQRWQMWSEKARHTLDAMEGDSEKTKISYFHHWIDGKGMGKTESWKNKKILISQEDYDKLEENKKEGKYSSEKIESYFTLFESLLAPKSNPLLAGEELHFVNWRKTKKKASNHIEATRGTQGGKHLKFPIAKHPKGPYKHHIVVRVDTGADVNCMNEKTFNELFPELQLSVCPHEIQNFRNSTADISILEQFCTYLEFRGQKYLNTFIVTNANDCLNTLSYGATFRMGVLLPNYQRRK